MEAETSLYAAEVELWREEHPRPNLGDFMIALSPSWSSPAGAAAA